MELKQLQYFVAVAEHLNFSKAAELLYVSQPLLSQQIAALEQELSVSLFTRNSRSVQLTPAGFTLLRDARNIIAHSEAAVKSVRQAHANIGQEGELRIGFEEVFERTRITQSLFKFSSEYPSVKTTMTCLNFSSIMHAMSNNDIDLGFTILPNKRLSNQLEFRVIGRDNIALLAARALLKPEEGRMMDQLLTLSEELPLFMLDKDTRGMNSIMQTCIDIGISPQFQFCDSVHTVLMNVEAGNGISILPNTIIETFSSEYLFALPLTDEPTGALCLVACWDKNNLNPYIAKFLRQFGEPDNSCDECPNPTCSGHNAE